LLLFLLLPVAAVLALEAQAEAENKNKCFLKRFEINEAGYFVQRIQLFYGGGVLGFNKHRSVASGKVLRFEQ
jgi:hypothetical protein